MFRMGGNTGGWILVCVEMVQIFERRRVNHLECGLRGKGS